MKIKLKKVKELVDLVHNGTVFEFVELVKRKYPTLHFRSLVRSERPLSKHMGSQLFIVSRKDCLLQRVHPAGLVNVTTALVGKGVIFDTGGYDIKHRMYGMHSDKAGAIAVLGALEQMPKNLAKHTVGLVGFCINDLTLFPGTLLKSSQGKNVEVQNTDAEGRLLLADLLEMCHYPNVITIATLTGMAGYVGGDKYALMYAPDHPQFTTHNEKLGLMLMPKFESVKAEMSKRVKDTIANSAPGPDKNGSTTAFRFLQHFKQKHTKLLHLDIAGVATDKHERATGYGVEQLLYLRGKL